jgi:DnaJ-class molecular chaperone
MKDKGGRPFGSEPTVRKSYSITVHQEIWVKTVAKKLGISESAWVRLCIESAMQTAREAMKQEFKPLPKLCGYCNGSGEGMFDGTVCWECSGKGVVEPKDERDETE